MKGVLTLRIVFLLFFAIHLSFCNSHYEGKVESSADIFRDFKAKDNVSYFTVPPRMASIFIDNSQAGSEHLKTILSDINHVSLLVISNTPEDSIEDYFSTLNAQFESINFTDFATLTSGNDVINIKTFKSKGDIQEMVVLVSNTENLFCIGLTGSIDLATIDRLAQPQNMDVISTLNQFARR